MDPAEKFLSLACISLPTSIKTKLGITQTLQRAKRPSERNGEKSQGKSRSLTNTSQVTYVMRIRCFNPIHMSWGKNVISNHGERNQRDIWSRICCRIALAKCIFLYFYYKCIFTTINVSTFIVSRNLKRDFMLKKLNILPFIFLLLVFFPVSPNCVSAF